MALTDSIVAYWTMDESSGANRLDSTGNSRTATNFGTVTAGTGIISNGGSAWSDTNYLSVADNDVFDATGAFSIQVWIRSTAWSGASMTLLSKEASGNGWRLYMQGSGNPLVFQVNQATNHIATGTFSTSTWYQIVVTRASGGNITFYVNGSQDTAGQAYTAPTVNTAAMLMGRTVIEARPMNTNAVMDEIGFWNRELTSGEVSELYNSGAALAYPFAAAGATRDARALNMLGVG